MKTWQVRVRDLLRKRGWAVAELARRAGLEKEALYKQLQSKVQQPRGDVLARIAGALNTTEIYLRHAVGLPYKEVPVVGYASAGEEFRPFDENPQGQGYDMLPLEFGDAPIAIEVRGTSMRPAYNPGDRLICDRHDGEMVERCVGFDCVVRTTTGAGYIKRLLKGSARGLYTLRSHDRDFEDILDVRLVWAAPVMWVRRGMQAPREQRATGDVVPLPRRTQPGRAKITE